MKGGAGAVTRAALVLAAEDTRGAFQSYWAWQDALSPQQAASGTESSAIGTSGGPLAMTLLAREVGPFKLDEVVRRKHVRAMPWAWLALQQLTHALLPPCNDR